MKNAAMYFIFLIVPMAGIAQWSDNPSMNTKIIDILGTQAVPKIVVNEEGETYISWYNQPDSLSYFELYLQHLNADGMKLWYDEGLLINDHPTWTWVTDYDLIIDSEDHAIVVMQDARNGYSDVFAYRISPEGTFTWGPDGIALTNDNDFKPSPSAVVTTDENIVVMWGVGPSDTTKFSYISLQKLSKDGQTLWDVNTIISTDSMHCLMPGMIATEDNGVIVMWITTVSTDTSEVGNWPYMYPLTQKIDEDGNQVWPEHLVLDTDKNMPLSFFAPAMESDGNGGFFAGWMAFPEGPFYNTYLQYVTSEGIPQWTPDGMNVSDSVQYKHSNPSLTYFPEHDELFVFWNVLNEYEGFEAVYGQKYSIDGQNQWTTGGRRFVGWVSAYDSLLGTSGIRKTTEDDLTLFYAYEFITLAGTDTIISTDYLARRIDRDGNSVWEGSDLVFTNAKSAKGELNVSRMVNDQYIATWEDNREDPENYYQAGIYAQNITKYGNLGPTAVNDPMHDSNLIIGTYPNPVDHTLTITYRSDRNGAMELSLYDITGNLIKHHVLPCQYAGDYTYTLDISELQAGVYIVQLQHNGMTGYHKIVKW